MSKIGAFLDALDMAKQARLKRARDMGFDVDRVWYHGTAKEGYVTDTDIKAFDQSKVGDRWSAEDSGFFFTSDPREGSYYARADIDYKSPGEGGGAVYPTYLKTKTPLVIDRDYLQAQGMADIPTRDGNISFWDDYQSLIREWADEAGADSVILRESDTGKEMAVVFDPSQIRSVNAAFDPAKKDSANLLASAAPVAVGLGAALAPSEEAEAGVITKAGRRMIDAWHGSPHDFDRFDMSRIGTGEGAQAYGHGLYFADAKEAGETYQRVLGSKGGWSADTSRLLENLPSDVRSNVMEKAPLSINDIGAAWMSKGSEYAQNVLNTHIDDTRRLAGQYLDEGDVERAQVLREQADALIDFSRNVDWESPKGHLYRVNIDVDPDTLLDWDKPLSQQPESVRGRLLALGIPEDDPRTGRELYYGISAEMARQRGATSAPGQVVQSNPQEGSAMLAQAGIPGIRYQDQLSRGSEGGTYNYVMFDDKPISIVERGAATPAFMSALAGAATAAAGGVNWALEATEIPTRGLHGLASFMGELAAGKEFDEAVAKGAQVSRQPLDVTAQQLGEYVADETGSPYLAAFVDAITRVMSLEP